MRTARWMATALMAVASGGWAKGPDLSHEYGPQPTWQEFQAIAEKAIAARLKDPDSARFRWRYDMHKGAVGIFMGGTRYGYLTCGFVNAKNSYGGYTGETTILVVIDFGVVQGTDMDSRTHGMVEEKCQQAVAKGLLVARSNGPPPDHTEDGADAPVAETTLGLAIIAVAGGAHIAKIVSGGPADRAGLTSGMVIASVNGIAVRGMPIATIQQILAAAQDDLSLTMVDGSTFKLALLPASLSPPHKEPRP